MPKRPKALFPRKSLAVTVASDEVAVRRAAIITVGSELTNGLRIDTNTAEIARALVTRGFFVDQAVSVADDINALSSVISLLLSTCELVITTGGLGPTHDDITREAASRALEVELEVDPRILELLGPLAARYADPVAAQQVMVQAEVIPGARVIDFTTGTAPGLVVQTSSATLIMLPGPPSEMRPMLRDALEPWPETRATPHELCVVGLGESEVQIAAQRVLRDRMGVGFTILAKPGDVRVLLMDEGCGHTGLAEAADAVAGEVGDAVYSRDGRPLSEVVLTAANDAGIFLATAESCTGGLVCGALTEVPGSSAVVRGGIIAYDNQVKIDELGVPQELITKFGAVSEQCACAMAAGAAIRLKADIVVAVTGIAGPGGGTEDKPVGTVWFAVADGDVVVGHERRFLRSSRESVRARATSTALDLLRRTMLLRKDSRVAS